MLGSFLRPLVTRSFIFSSGTLRLPSTPLISQQRWYNPQALVDWTKIKTRARATWIQGQNRKPRIRKSALDRFRLTRFGWQHRRSGLHSGNRRNMRSYLKKRHRGIGYVHQRNFKTMEKYFPHLKLRPRPPPTDKNPNLLFGRSLLPAHIG